MNLHIPTHAETQRAYSLGYAAERQGKGFLDNPYDSMTDLGRLWIDGLVASMRDRKLEEASAILAPPQ